MARKVSAVDERKCTQLELTRSFLHFKWLKARCHDIAQCYKSALGLSHAMLQFGWLGGGYRSKSHNVILWVVIGLSHAMLY